MRFLRVSSFFAEVTQQIHSLRASGVISAHTSLATSSASIALRKSAGIRCNIVSAFRHETVDTHVGEYYDRDHS